MTLVLLGVSSCLMGQKISRRTNKKVKNLRHFSYSVLGKRIGNTAGAVRAMFRTGKASDWVSET